MIRITLYGLTDKPQATFDLKPGEKLDVEHRPVFTFTRITVESVDVQEELDIS